MKYHLKDEFTVQGTFSTFLKINLFNKNTKKMFVNVRIFVDFKKKNFKISPRVCPFYVGYCGKQILFQANWVEIVSVLLLEELNGYWFYIVSYGPNHFATAHP